MDVRRHAENALGRRLAERAHVHTCHRTAFEACHANLEKLLTRTPPPSDSVRDHVLHRADRHMVIYGRVIRRHGAVVDLLCALLALDGAQPTPEQLQEMADLFAQTSGFYDLDRAAAVWRAHEVLQRWFAGDVERAAALWAVDQMAPLSARAAIDHALALFSDDGLLLIHADDAT